MGLYEDRASDSEIVDMLNDPRAVYCWENSGCGKRLLRIIDGKRTLDIFVDALFFEGYDLPEGFDLLSLQVYGTYNRHLASDEELDTYTPVGPRLTREEVQTLFVQKAFDRDE